jgi:hypothetical protein
VSQSPGRFKAYAGGHEYAILRRGFGIGFRSGERDIPYKIGSGHEARVAEFAETDGLYLTENLRLAPGQWQGPDLAPALAARQRPVRAGHPPSPILIAFTQNPSEINLFRQGSSQLALRRDRTGCLLKENWIVGTDRTDRRKRRKQLGLLSQQW